MNNFSFPATFQKSGEEKNGRIPIRIIPSAPTVDRQNDKIVLKAFDEACIKSFLFDGVIDWDHQSLLAKSEIEKARAIIGEPENFFIDEESGLPICDGFLFKSNPFVRDSIYPALEAGSNRFGASIGGSILLKSNSEDPVTKKTINEISKIRMKHIAVTPLQKAVNQSTNIELRKSVDENQGVDVFFPDFDTFLKSFNDAEYFYKTLQAGSFTDSSSITGGQAIQTQSLEGDRVKHVMPFVLEALIKGQIKGTYNNWMEYLTERGLSESEADEMIKTIALRSPQIAKLIF